MSFRTLSLAAAGFVCLVGSASAQSVTLEFDNGHVSVRAQNAPIRMILNEWTRLGGTQIVNGDGIRGGPVTLELTGVPERQALDILLREASGYIVGPQQAAASNASVFNRIVIVPTSSAPANLPPPAAFASPMAPGFGQQFPQPDDFPDEFIANDPPFDQFGVPAGQGPDDPNVNNRRFRVPRDFVPPDDFDAEPNLLFQPDPPGADELEAPVNQPGARPGTAFPANPFVTPPGGLRPGEIAPVPQPQGRTPQIDDDP